MEGFLDYVVRRLVDRPDEFRIDSREDGDIREFILHLHPDDVGKVIGRHGKTIGAIRILLNTAASKHGLRVIVNIDGELESRQRPEDANA